MKVLTASDFHPDVVTGGVSRFHEVANAVQETVNVAIDNKVDLYVFPGDLCDPDDGPSVLRCVDLAIDAAITLHQAGIPSVWIAGNHDVVEDGSGITTLTPMLSLMAACPSVYVFEVSNWENIAGMRVLALPFTATSHTYDPAEAVRKMPLPPAGTRTLIVGHLKVEGVQPGEETTEMPRGRDIVFPREVCRERFPNALLINGHYHRQQIHDGVHIPGSLARLTFGERDYAPGFMIIEVP
jgi:DNA repair exonuclease SbcCD nuclease subunit